jgi:nucleotide-binding universal stress UspA family protein
MYHHILGPLDGSALAESALYHAVAVGRPFEARITLVRVFGPEGPGRVDGSISPLDWNVIHAEARRYLSDQAERLEKAGAAVDTHVLEGTPAREITEFIRRQEIDLVVLSSHGKGGLSPWTGGGTAQKVLWRAGVSVLLTPAFRPAAEDFAAHRYEKLLLPLDTSPRCEFVLPIAARLARHHRSRVIIAHVVHEPTLPRRGPLSADENDLMQRLIESNRRHAARDLSELAARMTLQDDAVSIRILTGHRPAESLHDLVEQESPDLLIMAAHGHSAGIRWPYGGTVISFIVYGRVPLLIAQDVRPNELKPTAAEGSVAQKKGH